MQRDLSHIVFEDHEMGFLIASSRSLFTEEMWNRAKVNMEAVTPNVNVYKLMDKFVVDAEDPITDEEREAAKKLFNTRCTTSISKLPNGFFIRFLKAIEDEVDLHTYYSNGLVRVGFYYTPMWSLIYQDNSETPYHMEQSPMLSQIKMIYHMEDA